jgi:hypothetical protein
MRDVPKVRRHLVAALASAVGYAKVGLALGCGLAGLPINAEATALASAVGYAKVGLAFG